MSNHQWFFTLEEEDLKSIIIKRNTGTRTKDALMDIHGGLTFAAAAKKHGIKKQHIYYWLTTTAKILKVK